ncbi:hypothetical protein ScPMuIL_007100 [Solemya velum]
MKMLFAQLSGELYQYCPDSYAVNLHYKSFFTDKMYETTSSSSEEEEGSRGLEAYGEFDEACDMNSAYCRQMTVEQFEEQGQNETEKALQQLMAELSKNPAAIRSLLQKRKKEDMENAGVLSFLKAKMYSFMMGDRHQAFEVSDKDVHMKLDSLKTGMQKAFDYSKENRCRRSARLSEQRNKNAQNKSRRKPQTTATTTTTTTTNGIPPAPPVPLASPEHCDLKTPKRKVKPLRNKNLEVDTPPSMRARRMKRTGSKESLKSLSPLGSLSSLHVELMSATRIRQLRATHNLRTPGGTPLNRRPACPDSPSSVTEPLYRAFLTSMQHKFRNVRSPSPSPANGLYNNVMSPRSASRSPDFAFTP